MPYELSSPKDQLTRMGLLPSKSIQRLIAYGIQTPEVLYILIQAEPEKAAELLEIDKENVLALGTLVLLDWVDIKFAKTWIDHSFRKTGTPIKLDNKYKNIPKILP